MCDIISMNTLCIMKNLTLGRFENYVVYSESNSNTLSLG